jgi:hypothetical protein
MVSVPDRLVLFVRPADAFLVGNYAIVCRGGIDAVLERDICAEVDQKLTLAVEAGRGRAHPRQLHRLSALAEPENHLAFHRCSLIGRKPGREGLNTLLITG